MGTRDLDLTLNMGELVAVVSQMDTRGDRRRWLVDGGGKVDTWNTLEKVTMHCSKEHCSGVSFNRTNNVIEFFYCVEKTDPTLFILSCISGLFFSQN